MTKAVFFDIDGTIFDNQHGISDLTPRVKTAMKKLQAQGHKIFIATGRPYHFIPKNLKNFGFDGLICCNGALIFLDGEIFSISYLDKKIVEIICEYSAAENLQYILESYPDTYLQRNFNYCENFLNKIGVGYENFVRDFDVAKISVAKIEFVSERTDLENLDRAYKKILSLPGVTGWSDPFHFKTTEVYSDTISKATGILKVLEHLKISVRDSYAFGDGHNDVEMIQTVGTGFVMATAKDEVKKFAARVVPGVHEDGVAVGIEKYIL